MAYICGSSIYVSLHVSGVYTTIHIRQHLDGMGETTGKTQINRDGLILTTDEFALLLYQLNAIEKSFKREEESNSAFQSNMCPPTLLTSSSLYILQCHFSFVSMHSSARNALECFNSPYLQQKSFSFLINNYSFIRAPFFFCINAF